MTLRPLLQFHLPTFIPACAAVLLLLWQFFYIPYVVKAGPYVIEQSPIFPVDPDTCTVGEDGWLIPDTCQRKTMFSSGERFSFQYHVKYGYRCAATFTPWMNCQGATTLGPENWGGSTTGHPENKDGKFISRPRTLPDNMPPGECKWQIHSVACGGEVDEWTAPTSIWIRGLDG